MSNSCIFVFEGCDGSGKTTICNKVKKKLNKELPYAKVTIIHYPNPAGFGYKKIKEMLKDKSKMIPTDFFQMLFILNMRSTNINKVNPLLKEDNNIVLLDRSIISTLIYNKYQGGSLLNNIVNDLYKKYGINIKIDFDIINKRYCELEYDVNSIYMIKPPLDIVLEHASQRENKNSKEVFDSKFHTVRLYKEYNDFMKGIYLSKNYCDKKYKFCFKWEDELDEETNYNNMIDMITGNIINQIKGVEN